MRVRLDVGVGVGGCGGGAGECSAHLTMPFGKAEFSRVLQQQVA